MAATALACPRCGDRYPASARFCERCRLPLVVDDPRGPVLEPVSPQHARFRKVKPQLTEGELVTVAQVLNQAEGELVQALLLEAGVPSMLRRSAGFDVPGMLAAGRRDVIVPLAGAQTAREVLLGLALDP